MEFRKKYKVHAYKHDGKLYRSWSETILIEETSQYIAMVNDGTFVKRLDGSYNKMREPAVVFYFKDRWFNVIAQLKKKGIYYYCNIASPFLIDGDYIKYIDYDLDLRVFPDGGFKILDGDEYRIHKKKMKYSSSLDKVIQYELDNLIKMYKERKGPFDKKEIKKIYKIYSEKVKK